MINSRIPEPVRPILDKYVSLMEQKSPGLIRAFYIVGSIALNGFNERFSDIDFVAVLDRRASPVDIESLRTLHKAIQDDFSGSKLSGSYLQMADLGRFENEVLPHPYYHDGKLHEAGYFEINSITWWVIKNHGIAIWGNEPEDLPFTVDWGLLLARMKENLIPTGSAGLSVRMHSWSCYRIGEFNGLYWVLYGNTIHFERIQSQQKSVQLRMPSPAFPVIGIH